MRSLKLSGWDDTVKDSSRGTNVLGFDVGSCVSELAELSHKSADQSDRGLNRGSKKATDRSFGSLVANLLVFLVPAFLAAALIFSYGVDTPWGDQWDGTLPLLEKLDAGNLRLTDLLAFHNEHRILFPRLIVIGLAMLTDWNIRAELLMIWVLACLCALSIWRASIATEVRGQRGHMWLLLGTNVMLFTPVQWENLLWGFQIGFFLPLACVTACVWIAPSWRPPWSLLWTALICFVCTFSVASGFCCWVLTAPLLLLHTDEGETTVPRVWWLAWVALGALTTFFYFQDYVPPEAHPSILEAFRHPLSALLFTLAYLGVPFWGSAPNVAPLVPVVVGFVLVAAFIVCLAYIWRYRTDRDLLRRAFPWISLAGWAVANALLTMFGRLGFGVHAAIASRYVSFAMMLPIALLFLGSLLFQHSSYRAGTLARHRRVWAWAAVLAAAFSSLFVYASLTSLESWKRFQHSRLTGKAALLLINVVDEPTILARNVHQGDRALKARTNFLNRMGYLRPPLVQSRRIQAIAAVDNRGVDQGPVGEFEQIAKSGDNHFVVSGWAILPVRHRTADGVILTYDDSDGQPTIFAMAEVGGIRADIQQQLNNSRYFRCGWRKSWSGDQVPVGARWIRAWAFDAEKCLAFQIGAASLEPPGGSP